MSKQEHWKEIFCCYKASGLSQSAFCKQNNIPSNQFQYRWYEHNKGLKVKASSEQFESVALMPGPPVSSLTPTIDMMIHLPNQIRCEVSVDLHGLSALLMQLMQLC